MIKLNIGGAKITTTQQVLLRNGDNYFAKLLSGQIPVLRGRLLPLPPQRVVAIVAIKISTNLILPNFAADDEDYIFLDRNGKVFQVILDYLRYVASHMTLQRTHTRTDTARCSCPAR